MAAPMATHVRIKVYFENNEFDASWLLIDTSDLRTMKDVQRYISLKFLGKNIPLYLTLQGCFLPDWEKSVILRDNDCVNAKCIHQDSYENQTILLSNTLEEEGNLKIHKQKKKKEQGETDSKFTHSRTNSEDNVNSNDKLRKVEATGKETLIKDSIGQRDALVELTSQDDNVAMETSPDRHKHKKKKKKYDNESELEKDKQKEKKRKRKIENEEKIESEHSAVEPICKRIAVDVSIGDSHVSSKNKSKEQDDIQVGDSHVSSKNKSKEQDDIQVGDSHVSSKNKSKVQDNCENDNLPSELLQQGNKDFRISDEQDSEQNQNGDIGDIKGEGKKRTKKRKRVRKRKRKNETEAVVQKSFSETPKNNTTNNSWNWGTGYLENKSNNSKSLIDKHKVFQSDSDESEDCRDTDNIQNSSAINTCNYKTVKEKPPHAHSEASHNSPVSKQSKSFSETLYGHDKTSEFSSTPKYGGTITKQTEQFTDQPSILSTSYLTNGVAVYSRNRRKQQNNPRQYVELSKEEQLDTQLTNVSVILQNTSHSDLRDVDDEVKKEIAAIYEAVPLDKNYSSFPLLVGPPRVGDRLVYKVIELSEDYSPEVSQYKEAVVCGYNQISKIVELENQLNSSISKKRHDGKFEIDLDDEENCNQQTDVKVCLPLDSLIEPKLLS